MNIIGVLMIVSVFVLLFIVQSKIIGWKQTAAVFLAVAALYVWIQTACELINS